MNSIRSLTLVAFLHLSTAVALAQTPLLDSGAAPHVDLTSVQKQTIYQSISKTQKNNAAKLRRIMPRLRAFVRPLVPSCPMV
jgi:hypothetical protein